MLLVIGLVAIAAGMTRFFPRASPARESLVSAAAVAVLLAVLLSFEAAG